MMIGSRTNKLNLSDLEAMPVGQNVIAYVKGGHTVRGVISSPDPSRDHLRTIPGEGGKVFKYSDGKPFKVRVRITSVDESPDSGKRLPDKFKCIGADVWFDTRGLECAGEVETAG